MLIEKLRGHAQTLEEAVENAQRRPLLLCWQAAAPAALQAASSVAKIRGVGHEIPATIVRDINGTTAVLALQAFDVVRTNASGGMNFSASSLSAESDGMSDADDDSSASLAAGCSLLVALDDLTALRTGVDRDQVPTAERAISVVRRSAAKLNRHPARL